MSNTSPEPLAGYTIDEDRTLPNQIVGYAHCEECLNALPDNFSPRQWLDVEVGFTADGALQIWCKRHDMNVAIIHPPVASA